MKNFILLILSTSLVANNLSVNKNLEIANGQLAIISNLTAGTCALTTAVRVQKSGRPMDLHLLKKSFPGGTRGFAAVTALVLLPAVIQTYLLKKQNTSSK